jgi:TetR/AcrR family transcriptional regulator
MAHARKLQPAQSGEAVDRILIAAERLFAEHGFDAVSMNAIAEASGVSKANVFHHFNTKNDLYLAVLRGACNEITQHLDRLGDDRGALTDRFGAFADAHLKSLIDREPITRLILRELLSGNPRLGQELAEKVFGEKFAQFVAILRAGQQAGTLRKDIDPAMVATLLIGADVFFVESRDVLRHLPGVKFSGQPARYSRMLADILLHGILPKKK